MKKSLLTAALLSAVLVSVQAEDNGSSSQRKIHIPISKSIGISISTDNESSELGKLQEEKEELENELSEKLNTLDKSLRDKHAKIQDIRKTLTEGGTDEKIILILDEIQKIQENVNGSSSVEKARKSANESLEKVQTAVNAYRLSLQTAKDQTAEFLLLIYTFADLTSQYIDVLKAQQDSIFNESIELQEETLGKLRSIKTQVSETVGGIQDKAGEILQLKESLMMLAAESEASEDAILQTLTSLYDQKLAELEENYANLKELDKTNHLAPQTFLAIELDQIDLKIAKIELLGEKASEEDLQLKETLLNRRQELQAELAE